jgi:hypothetical protein
MFTFVSSPLGPLHDTLIEHIRTMDAYEEQNTPQHVINNLREVDSPPTRGATIVPSVRVDSPAISVHSIASMETNAGSENAPQSYAAAFATAVGRQRALTFNLVEWGWNDDDDQLELPPGPTPRQRTLSLPRVVAGPSPGLLGLGSSSQLLRPIPAQVPESCPSLYRPGPGSLVNDDGDSDSQTEADSIWFVNDASDAQVVTSASTTNLIDVMDSIMTNGNEPLAFNPPEPFEDFPDLAAIIATLRMTNEDVIVEGAIEDLNLL